MLSAEGVSLEFDKSHTVSPEAAKSRTHDFVPEVQPHSHHSDNSASVSIMRFLYVFHTTGR